MLIRIVMEDKVLTDPLWPFNSSNSFDVCLSHTITDWSSDPDTTLLRSELIALTGLQELKFQVYATY